jgi:hypothetical protein
MPHRIENQNFTCCVPLFSTVVTRSADQVVNKLQKKDSQKTFFPNLNINN